MSKVQMLRVFVSQRLSLAAEEIFELFERTIAGYEEELCRCKQEKERHQKLEEAAFSHEVCSHTAGVQHLQVRNKEQHQQSHSLEQEDPKKFKPMKMEVEELTVIQKGEWLPENEEPDGTKFTFTPVSVKCDEDEEKPQSSRPHQTQIEEDRDAEHLKSSAVEEGCSKTSHSSQSECEVSRGLQEASEPPTGLNLINSLQYNERSLSYMNCNTGNVFLSSSECATSFGQQDHLQKNKEIQRGPKRLVCSVCKKTFPWKSELVRHMRTHSGEKPFSCSVCGSRFTRSSTLYTHLRNHAGQKPFTCTVCKVSFSRNNYLVSHMKSHTGEKPFRCPVCGKRFARLLNMRQHITVHTGAKAISCSVCGKNNCTSCDSEVPTDCPHGENNIMQHL